MSDKEESIWSKGPEIPGRTGGGVNKTMHRVVFCDSMAFLIKNISSIFISRQLNLLA